MPVACGICGVHHGRDPPSMNSLAGAYFRGRDINPVYTEFETGLLYFINPAPGHLIGKEGWVVRRCREGLQALLSHPLGYLLYFPPNQDALLGEAR